MRPTRRAVKLTVSLMLTEVDEGKVGAVSRGGGSDLDVGVEGGPGQSTRGMSTMANREVRVGEIGSQVDSFNA